VGKISDDYIEQYNVCFGGCRVPAEDIL
jgi:hypothetical protein